MVEDILNNISGALGRVVFFNVFSLFGESDVDFPLVFFVLLSGYIIVCFQLRFVPLLQFGKCIKYTFGFGRAEKSKTEEVSSLKVLFASVASCTGMNTVAGMVFMICIGGPGTVFWIPLLAFLCLPFRFAEVYLSHSMRSSKSGEFLGGPFDYMTKGFSQLKMPKIGRSLAFLYALIMMVFGVVGASMYESNQFVSVISGSFSLLSNKRFVIGIFLVILLSYIMLGGTRRVISYMNIIFPVIAIVYFFVSLIVVFANYQKLGDAFVMIFNDAMQPRAMAGGFVASLCMCARKICLAHETGLGTSGIVHSSSSEKDSVVEATVSMMTPIISSLFVSLMSALVLILTGFYKPEYANGGVVSIFQAFKSVNSVFPYIVTILVPVLAFNVLVGWSNYISKCAKYCFNNKKIVVLILSLFVIMAFIGAIIDNFVLIMNLVDSLVCSIIFINVPVVILLSGRVWKVLKDYKFK